MLSGLFDKATAPTTFFINISGVTPDLVYSYAFSGGNAMLPASNGLDTTALAHYMERLSGALAVTSDADCVLGNLPLPWPPI